ncbi:MAG: ATP-binding cassette domain-containing protein, partial [Sciscionella sp.]
MTLHLDELRVDLAGRMIVSGATVIVGDGEVSGVIGPNGSGKSTLLRTVYRHLRPRSGRVLLGDTDVWTLRPSEAARHIAAVPQ